MRKQYSFVFDQKLIIPVLVAIATKFKIKLNSFAKFYSLQSFKQIEVKTPEILYFYFFTVLQDCVCDVIFK